MKCPNCGRKIPPDNRICRNCGAEIRKDEQPYFAAALAFIVIIAIVVLSVLYIKGSFSSITPIETADTLDIGTPSPHRTVAPPTVLVPPPTGPWIFTPQTPAPRDSQTPVGSPEITAEPTPEVTNAVRPKSEFALCKLSDGKPASVAGHIITISYSDDNSYSIVTIDKNKTQIDGATDIYSVCFPSGTAGLLVNIDGFEENLLRVYRISSDGSLDIANMYANSFVTHISGRKIILCEQIDCFGTWMVERKYNITEKLSLRPCESKATVSASQRQIQLHIIHDICAKTPVGTDVILSKGCTVTVRYINIGKEKSACMEDSDGNLYTVMYIVTDNGTSVKTPDGQLDEYKCFDNLPYSS